MEKEKDPPVSEDDESSVQLEPYRDPDAPPEYYDPVEGETPSKQILIKPRRHEKQILREWFKYSPKSHATTMSSRIKKMSEETGFKPEVIKRTLAKAAAEEEAKLQRREYADKIYGEKIPFCKRIVGLGLEELESFVANNKPQDWKDASVLCKMLTDMQMLLRLELGQSTTNVEMVVKTSRDITSILKDLKSTDPFVDYPEVVDVTPKEKSEEDR